MNEKLRCFNIEVDDIENVDFENGMIQQIARKYADEMDLRRFELILNRNIITVKDKFTGINSYMGIKISLEPLEKDISFIVRPTNEPTYEELQQENKQLKHIIDELEKWLEENKYFYSGLQGEDLEEDTTIIEVLDKLQELKGSDKE